MTEPNSSLDHHLNGVPDIESVAGEDALAARRALASMMSDPDLVAAMSDPGAKGHDRLNQERLALFERMYPEEGPEESSEEGRTGLEYQAVSQPAKHNERQIKNHPDLGYLPPEKDPEVPRHGYNFAVVPEGFTPDPDLASAASAWFTKAKLSTLEATSLVDAWHRELARKPGTYVESARPIEEIWGADTEHQVKQVHDFITKNGGKTALQLLESSGLARNARVLGTLHQIMQRRRP